MYSTVMMSNKNDVDITTATANLEHATGLVVYKVAVIDLDPKGHPADVLLNGGKV